MKYALFSKDPDVLAFVNWFCSNHSRLKVNLKIKSTRFVPGGTKAKVTGFANVLDHYRWKSKGMTTGDWQETISVLGTLSKELMSAVDAGNASGIREATRKILVWGGNRNWKVGAWPFISNMTDVALVQYLQRTRSILHLGSAHLPLPGGTDGILLMNAMLTKVHALNAGEGLPIYDSRVAAAMACLIELWRMQEGRQADALPSLLTFPATDPARTVTVMSSKAKVPTMMSQCEAPSQAWSECKVRLGWLIHLILEQSPDLFSSLASHNSKVKKGQSAGTRAHAFESTLFMLGYDPACLTPTKVAEADLTARRAKAVKAACASLPGDPAQYPQSTPTLTGTEADVHYRYADGEYDVLWKTAKLRFSEELVEDILDLMEQAGDEGILLSASQTGTPPEGSVGALLKEAGYSPRAGSALAAILRDQGLIVSEGKKGIRLRLAQSDA